MGNIIIVVYDLYYMLLIDMDIFVPFVSDINDGASSSVRIAVERCAMLIKQCTHKLCPEIVLYVVFFKRNRSCSHIRCNELREQTSVYHLKKHLLLINSKILSCFLHVASV